VADRLTWRRYYARGKRHDHESYGAVCAAGNANHGLAYLRVQGKREGLVYRADTTAVEVLVTQDSYVFSPLIVGGQIVWVERRRGRWMIRSLPTSSVATGRITEPALCTGRPIHLSAAEREDTSVLVWEERSGKRTLIRGVMIRDGQYGQVVDMTAGVCNAYDPQSVILSDGTVGLTYTAFFEGQYHVFVQLFGDTLFPVGLPVRVSDGPGAALYPSICERGEGGVWFSYARLRPGSASDRVVSHARYRAQAGLFSGSMTIAVGAFHNEQTLAPFAPAEGEPPHGFVAAMTAFGSDGGGHSRVFEDEDGRLRLLLRQHVDRQRIAYEDDDSPLARSRAHGAVEGGHCYSSVSLMTLGDHHWSTPTVLISAAHIQAPLSFGVDGRKLHFAFTEDGRHTGLNAAGEWMDDESEVAVGCAEIELSSGEAPRYEMRPYVIGQVPPEGIAEAAVEDADVGEYVVAMGQLHAHSEISVCNRETDRDQHFNYRFMQDVQHCDFGAITDHAFNMWHTEMLLMRKLAEYYYFPGEFVALQGYEWTGSSLRSCSHEGGPWGHVSLVMLGEDADLDCYYPGDSNCEGRSLGRLCELMRELPVVALPHHMADTRHPFKWSDFDGQVMPLVELFEDTRGSCERPVAPGVSHTSHNERGPWCDIELLGGKRFGFVGGGAHCGAARAGVLTRDLTRSALYESLTARRCFASSGVGLLLEFTFNGEPMGSEVEAREGEFVLAVAASEEIFCVQIVRNGLDEEQLAVRSPSFRHVWAVKRRRHGEFWYCRILMSNGELAWTSPIWID
jgi:hypothetical protein